MIKKHILNFMYVRYISCFFLLSLSCGIEKKTARNDIPALQIAEDSLSLEKTCEKISLSVLFRLREQDTSSLALFYRTLDKTADSLKKTLGKDAPTLIGMRAILDVVYKNWEMAFDPRDDAIETALPHLAFCRKKGNCLGVSLMVLMLAERLQCPIYGVVLPGHFFCRFDDGTARVNIEPNKSGYAHPDEYYRGKYLSQGYPWYDLKILTKKEISGVLLYAVGTLFLKRNDPGFAAACLKESRRRVPSLVEAAGNHALALALCGSGDSAMAIFGELFGKYPSLSNLAANYGAVAMASGRHQEAFRIYRKGLDYFPSDPKLLIGLSQAFAASKKKNPGRFSPK